MSARPEGNFSWTDPLVADLKRLVADGHSYSQIGRALGCSRSAAIGKANRMGWKPDQASALAKTWAPVDWTPEMDAELRSASTGGKTMQDAATRLGVTWNQVVYRCRAIDIAFPKSKFQKAASMANARSAGAAMLGVGANGVRPKPSIPWADRIEAVGRLTLLELGAHHCKWPIGDPQADNFRFCGDQKMVGSYCAKHARVAFVVSKPRPPTTEIRQRRAAA